LGANGATLMARRGDGIYRRGPTWWLDFLHDGRRHVARLGKNISRTVAREPAQRARERILHDEERQRGAPHPPDVPQIALAGTNLRFSAGQVKYVGASRHGLGRPFHPQHHVLKHTVPGPQDALVHFAVPSWYIAARLERDLIHALQTVWNGTQNGEGR
jgi:hypothetical protein